MFCTVNSLGLFGIDAFSVQVEVDIARAMPAFDLVGLPDAAVKESRDRVRSALRNCGFSFPVAKVLVNLAPADIRKSGPLYDLPILMGILLASEALSFDPAPYAFVGELSLSGELKGVTGILPMVLEAKRMGCQAVFIPHENAAEGAVAEGIQVYAVQHISQLVEFFRGAGKLPTCRSIPFQERPIRYETDFSEVKGQAGAKRAMEIAAAGGHNLLLIGAPGSGKSMLAKRLPSILPEMSFAEAIETTKIHSIAGILPADCSLVNQRPFRSPHHTISPAGLVGGGSIPVPGEISLAHNGVLFLDEFPEFNRNALEILRQPLEDGTVTIARASSRMTYPCSFTLVAAMNPCPCGYFGHPARRCTCSPAAAAKYLSKVSGPMLDRLDLHVEVMPVEFSDLASAEKGESSEAIRKRVNQARERQRERLEETGVLSNARLSPSALQRVCSMTERAQAMLKGAFERLGLSARAYDRILKVSRTIADLENCVQIDSTHIAQAIQYRSLDRKYWNR